MARPTLERSSEARRSRERALRNPKQLAELLAVSPAAGFRSIRRRPSRRHFGDAGRSATR